MFKPSQQLSTWFCVYQHHDDFHLSKCTHGFLPLHISVLLPKCYGHYPGNKPATTSQPGLPWRPWPCSVRKAIVEWWERVAIFLNRVGEYSGFKVVLLPFSTARERCCCKRSVLHGMSSEDISLVVLEDMGKEMRSPHPQRSWHATVVVCMGFMVSTVPLSRLTLRDRTKQCRVIRTPREINPNHFFQDFWTSALKDTSDSHRGMKLRKRGCKHCMVILPFVFLLVNHFW